MLSRKDEELFDSLNSKVVFSIGNNVYKDENYPNLKKCSDDAECIYQTFMNQKALKADKINSILLNNNLKDNISKSRLIEQLKGTISSVGENDQFIFYYSGHGEVIDGEFAFVLYDSISTDTDTYMKYSELTGMLENCDARQKIVIIDACFSGLILVNEKGGNITKETLKKAFDTSKGTIVIASSKGNQSSTEKSPGRNSLFTHFLCEGLNNRGIALYDYVLSVFNLYEFAFYKMIEYCKSAGIDEQIAVINATTEGVPALATYKLFDDGNWYKDNYAKIVIYESKPQFIDWLDALVVFVQDNIWKITKDLIQELVQNAYDHGNANDCEITVFKDALLITDDGCEFNQLSGCKKEYGGASMTIDMLREVEGADPKIEYSYNNGRNQYKIDFMISQAFDIKEQCTIKVPHVSLSFEEGVNIPQWECKYYFLEVNGPISFDKRWIESALKKIPKNSILVVEGDGRLKGYYEEESRIEFRTDRAVEFKMEI